jgi:hypothetical protein
MHICLYSAMDISNIALYDNWWIILKQREQEFTFFPFLDISNHNFQSLLFVYTLENQ